MRTAQQSVRMGKAKVAPLEDEEQNCDDLPEGGGQRLLGGDGCGESPVPPIFRALRQWLLCPRCMQGARLTLPSWESTRHSPVFTAVLQSGITVNILFTVICVCMQSLDGPNHYPAGYGHLARFPSLPSASFYFGAEIASTCIFMLELVVRMKMARWLWFRPLGLPSNAQQPFFRSFLSWMDVIVACPLFVRLAAGFNVSSGTAGLLELCRVLSMLKLFRFYSGTSVLLEAVERSIRPLVLPVGFFFTIALQFGALLVFVEPCYDALTCPFKDVFNGAFFATVTMTSVGYGDQVPRTLGGKLLSVVIMLVGALFLSMPLAIIGNEFATVWMNSSAIDEDATRNREQVMKQGVRARMKQCLINEVTRSHLDTQASSASAIKDDVLDGLTNVCGDLGTHQSINGSSKHFSVYRHLVELQMNLLDLRAKLDRSAAHAVSRISAVLPTALKCCTLMESLIDDVKGALATSSSQLPKELVLEVQSVLDAANEKSDEESALVNASNHEAARMPLGPKASRSKTIVFHLQRFTQRKTLGRKTKRLAHELQRDSTFGHIMAAKGKKSWRNRLWLTLEVPSSSPLAKGIQTFLILLILLSIVMFGLESMTDLQVLGEQSLKCEKATQLYCSDKTDPFLDSGCFMASSRSQRLRYFCSELDCFGVGNNFGSTQASLSCTLEGGWGPFQTQEQLDLEYGPDPLLGGSGHKTTQQSHALCHRLECIDNSSVRLADASNIWVPIEIALNSIFTLEIILRGIVARHWVTFLKDYGTWVDIASVIPFYIELWATEEYGLDFTIGSTDPSFLTGIKMLRVLRILKITRHYHSSAVLLETVLLTWQKLLLPLGLLVFFTICFSVLIYYLEWGSECFVGGEPSCPSSYREVYPEGSRLVLNRFGTISCVPDVFSAMWFVLVTMTSVGYGDITATTIFGRLVMVIVMLFGTMYLAMPYSIVGDQFYSSYERIFSTDRVVRQLAQQAALYEPNAKSKTSLSDCKLLAPSKLDAPSSKAFTKFRNISSSLRCSIRSGERVLRTMKSAASPSGSKKEQGDSGLDGSGSAATPSSQVAAVPYSLPLAPGQKERSHQQLEPKRYFLYLVEGEGASVDVNADEALEAICSDVNSAIEAVLGMAKVVAALDSEAPTSTRGR